MIVERDMEDMQVVQDDSKRRSMAADSRRRNGDAKVTGSMKLTMMKKMMRTKIKDQTTRNPMDQIKYIMKTIVMDLTRNQ